jgi:hypothetical protein
MDCSVLGWVEFSRGSTRRNPRIEASKGRVFKVQGLVLNVYCLLFIVQVLGLNVSLGVGV